MGIYRKYRGRGILSIGACGTEWRCLVLRLALNGVSSMVRFDSRSRTSALNVWMRYGVVVLCPVITSSELRRVIFSESNGL